MMAYFSTTNVLNGHNPEFVNCLVFDGIITIAL